MTPHTMLPVLLVAGLVVLVLVVVVRLVWRRARAAAMRSIVTGRSGGGSLLGTLLVAAVVVGVQWAVAVHDPNPRVLLAVLAVPALFAGASLARLVSGSTVRSGRKGARR
ncbi:hypothetical protein [Kutzneria sp. CA-103260]|uniref:hypothetical protein n=1 Tax=Kutzneria sp. CA-103260 TaxID=2802641 RepID=UPI001BACAEEF|nr:hypothetical protein [Kutzneria sp. CA-103260]QUQ70579.1 hypothetical protein JJ691_83590 [Kutzneria sp. CA-103260]